MDGREASSVEGREKIIRLNGVKKNLDARKREERKRERKKEEKR